MSIVFAFHPSNFFKTTTPRKYRVFRDLFLNHKSKRATGEIRKVTDRHGKYVDSEPVKSLIRHWGGKKGCKKCAREGRGEEFKNCFNSLGRTLFFASLASIVLGIVEIARIMM